jgi:putative ABC transport system permease protein
MLHHDSHHALRLAWSDLRYEWILSLCMALALGAVFAPLFILLGLREGIIGTMLERLQQDPLSRLVMPKYPLQAPIDATFTAALNDRTAVTIQSAAPFLLLNVEGLPDHINALPSSSTDPLLIAYGLSVPAGHRWAVISQRLAESTGRGIGDMLPVVLERSAPERQRVPFDLPIAGVLPRSVSTEVQLWISTDMLRWLREWRRGLPVPTLGLGGAGGGLSPEYDGALTLITRGPSPEDDRAMVAGRGGFSQPPQSIADPGWDLPPGHQARLWLPVNSRVFDDGLSALRERHLERGLKPEIIPYLADFHVRLEAHQASASRRLVILGQDPQAPKIKGTEAALTPVWVSPLDSFADPFADPIVALVFASPGVGDIRIPARPIPIPGLHAGVAAVPRVFAGKMNAARRQAAVFDSLTREFHPRGEGDRFFRAYARSIDALPSLVDWIRAQGETRGDPGLKEPVSREAEVRQLHSLSRHMQTLYWLIAMVTGLSGLLAIAANVYAGVVRKRRDLAYLQLLGLGRWTLILVTALKSLVLVLGGLAVALGGYAVFASVSGPLFAGLGTSAGALTRLDALAVLGLVGAILVSASAASVAAATALLRIDPAEYLRE